MKSTAIIACMAASVAVVSATGGGGSSGGVTINPDGTYTCDKPDVAYCAGDSLKTDIIIRCYGTKGQPGRCSDNLAGEPPVGNFPSLCHQSDDKVGDAACEKNCVVYGGSGNGKGTFTLPADICKPTYTATSKPVHSTSVPTYPPSSKPTYPVSSKSTSIPVYPTYPVSSKSTLIPTHPTYPPPSSTTSEVPVSSTTKTYPTIPPHSSKTYPPHPPHSSEECTTETTTTYPIISTTVYPPVSPPPVQSSAIYPTGNNTIVTRPPPVHSSATGVPTGPSTPVTSPPVPAGAVHNSAGGALAVVALVAAYIL